MPSRGTLETRDQPAASTGTLVTPARAAKAPRRRRGELSREQILDAALAFIDRHGVDELSMRRLAAELGAGTMTIYGYFRDKDELLDAVVDAISARAPLPELSGSWREQVRQLAIRFNANLNEHPGLVRLRLERPILSPGALRITEEGMRILADAGFDPREAARAFRTVFVYTFGSAAFNPPGRVADAQRAVRVAGAALPPDEYPHLLRAVDEMAEVMDPGAQFERGLDLILDGLERRLDEKRGPRDLS
jgi:AcrR family transcriptional regulator